MDEMRHIPGLYLAHSERGRSMFSAEDVQPESVIEVCPIIFISEEEKKVIHQTVLHDYYFVWPGGGIALALGYGSIYNHSFTPNARVVFDKDASEIVIESLRTINAGEEILIDYTDGGSKEELWFVVK